MESFIQEDRDEYYFLLDNGAPQNGKDPHGMCPLVAATETVYVDKVRLLLDKSTEYFFDNWNSLHLAINNNRLKLALLSIEKGVDVNLQDAHEKIPLMLGCLKNNKPIVELLIKDDKMNVS
jgi:ankyrin repeat protein